MASIHKVSPANRRIAIAYQREAAELAKLALVYLIAATVIPEPDRLVRAKRYQREAAKLSKSARQLMGIEPLDH